MDIYTYMWGPSEFTATGTLKNYEGADKLPGIKIPSLFLGGEFDEARPSTVQYYQSLTPGSTYAMVENAAHITMHDNPNQNNQINSEFLKEIEVLSDK